jgi:hypothetical protein
MADLPTDVSARSGVCRKTPERLRFFVIPRNGLPAGGIRYVRTDDIERGAIRRSPGKTVFVFILSSLFSNSPNGEISSYLPSVDEKDA